MIMCRTKNNILYIKLFSTPYNSLISDIFYSVNSPSEFTRVFARRKNIDFSSYSKVFMGITSAPFLVFWANFLKILCLDYLSAFTCAVYVST